MIDDGRLDLHPAAGRPAVAAAVVLHPHPGMGGDRHHPVVVAVAERLAAAGVTAMRIDITAPEPAAAVPELLEAAALVCDRTGTDRLVLAGYSWGSIVTALAAGAALSPARLSARVLIAPPVTMQPLDGAPAAADGVPTLVLVPSHDQFGPPAEVRAALAGWHHASVEEVTSADHFLAGHSAAVATRATAWLTAILDAAP